METRSVPKSLQGYSPEALKEYGDLEMYNWAFKDLWDHDQLRIDVITERVEKRDQEIKRLKQTIDWLADKIETLEWKQTVV
jgi:predicted ribosome quality control (RQC) complex YloA/Tae2 family protein